MLDVALESGHVVKPSNGWYSRVDQDGVVEEKKYRIKDTETKEFWVPIITNKSFYDYVKNKYSIGVTDMIKSEDLENTLSELDLDDE